MYGYYVDASNITVTNDLSINATATANFNGTTNVYGDISINSVNAAFDVSNLTIDASNTTVIRDFHVNGETDLSGLLTCLTDISINGDISANASGAKAHFHEIFVDSSLNANKIIVADLSCTNILDASSVNAAAIYTDVVHHSSNDDATALELHNLFKTVDGKFIFNGDLTIAGNIRINSTADPTYGFVIDAGGGDAAARTYNYLSSAVTTTRNEFVTGIDVTTVFSGSNTNKPDLAIIKGSGNSDNTVLFMGHSLVGRNEIQFSHENADWSNNINKYRFIHENNTFKLQSGYGSSGTDVLSFDVSSTRTPAVQCNISGDLHVNGNIHTDIFYVNKITQNEIMDESSILLSTDGTDGYIKFTAPGGNGTRIFLTESDIK